MTLPTLTFGVNPFDRCPNDTGRYHVIDAQGFIRAKCQNGYTAYDHRSNLEIGVRGTVYIVGGRLGRYE